MLAMRSLSVILLVLTFAAACGTRPTTDIDAAKAALDRASASAAQYAPESLKAAQDANDALDAELAAQDARWIKSYDRARDLATSARLASEKAPVSRPERRGSSVLGPVSSTWSRAGRTEAMDRCGPHEPPDRMRPPRAT